MFRFFKRIKRKRQERKQRKCEEMNIINKLTSNIMAYEMSYIEAIQELETRTEANKPISKRTCSLNY